MTDLEHDNAYAGLLVDDAHWAFGTAAHETDPLAGVDAPVPFGVEAAELASYCRMLGDDALVASHRLSEWCSRAPDLEIDVALANIALDLLGQARLLLARAAAVDPGPVPRLPEGSPVPPEDRLAFFRDDFRNVRLAELPNGDYAECTVRLLLFSCWRLELLVRLRDSADPVLAAVAAKGAKEVTYHRDFAAQWFVTLARGTAESHRRLSSALAVLWRWWPELYDAHPVETALAGAGVGVDPAGLRAVVETVIAQVLDAAGMAQPDVAPVTGHGGRYGAHTEALSKMLAEMQVVARAHPMGRW